MGKLNKFVNHELLTEWLEKQHDKTVTTWSQLSDRISHYVEGEIDFHEFSKAMQWAWAEKLTAEWAEKDREEKDVATRYVGLIAHNKMKGVLTSFVAKYQDFFSKVPLVTTQSTGRTLNQSLGINVAKLVASGPLGGDQEPLPGEHPGHGPHHQPHRLRLLRRARGRCGRPGSRV